MDDLLNEFLIETSESLAKLDLELVELEHNPENPEILNSIFRTMHTIKGTCGFVGLPRLEKLAHASENVLVKVRDKLLIINEEVINVVLESIDGVKNIVTKLSETGGEPDGNDDAVIEKLHQVLEQHSHSKSNDSQTTVEEIDFDSIAIPADLELVSPAEIPAPEIAPITNTISSVPPVEKNGDEKSSPEKTSGMSDQNQTIRVNINTLENLINMVGELVLTRNQLMQLADHSENSALNLPLYRLNYVTSELQEQVMKTRMQPIGNAWLKLPRIVRDSAKELNKKIDLELLGAETELDRQVIELIKDPLTHMIRNAMDHGIESPVDRIKAGKSEKGVIRMNAYHAGGHIIIEIADDGRGLDVEKIRNKAIEKGLISIEEASQLTDHQVFQFIFKSGFSTAAVVTNISGRGVGMDVVRTNIEKIGGTIEIRSKQNKGTTFNIKIPLTLSIVSALIAEVAGYRFAIPQLNILELVQISGNSANKIEYVNGHPVLRLRQKLLALAHMDELLGLTAKNKTDDKHYVIVLQVGTSFFGIIVDKVFNTQEIVVKPVSSLIRNLSIFAGNTILGDGGVITILDPNHISGLLANINIENTDSQSQTIEPSTTKNRNIETFLLFLTQDRTPKAIPLSTLTRLEQINLNQVEYAENKPCIQYRNNLMSLVFMIDNTQQNDIKPVLVFSNDTHTLGLVVEEILDIIEGDGMNLKLEAHDPSKLGTTILKGHATEILNTDYFLQAEFSDWYSTSKNDTSQKKQLVFVGDHFYGANFLIPFLKISGFHVTALTNANELEKFFSLNFKTDGFILDVESDLISSCCANLQKQEAYSNIPKLFIANEPKNHPQNIYDGSIIKKLDRHDIISHVNLLFTKQPNV
ncbi:MAG: chemotaxis protein CheA [Alphaproteobacteria bacterium]|nr:chemotaxis protein CheA [Alphaproteobacteria bacterium]